MHYTEIVMAGPITPAAPSTGTAYRAIRLKLRRQYDGRPFEPSTHWELPPDAITRGVSFDLAQAAADEWNRWHTREPLTAVVCCFRRELFGTCLIRPSDFQELDQQVATDRETAIRDAYRSNHEVRAMTRHPRRWSVVLVGHRQT